MNFHLVLKLMTIPTLIGSLLTLGMLTERSSAIGATNTTTLTKTQASCDSSTGQEKKLSTFWYGHRSILVASAGSISDESTISNFSEAESDAAVVLFGCDCFACINALRQLRNQSLLNNKNGHCWASLRGVSPQTVQEVLQNLEMREAGQEP